MPSEERHSTTWLSRGLSVVGVRARHRADECFGALLDRDVHLIGSSRRQLPPPFLGPDLPAYPTRIRRIAGGHREGHALGSRTCARLVGELDVRLVDERGGAQRVTTARSTPSWRWAIVAAPRTGAGTGLHAAPGSLRSGSGGESGTPGSSPFSLFAGVARVRGDEATRYAQHRAGNGLDQGTE
jgi:hypothetical protein